MIPSGKVSGFWRSKSGNVYFRLYGHDKAFLVGFDSELIEFLCKNLSMTYRAVDKGEYWLCEWFSFPKIHLRDDSGDLVAWGDRAIELYQTITVPRTYYQKRRIYIQSDETDGMYPFHFIKGSKRVRNSN